MESRARRKRADRAATTAATAPKCEQLIVSIEHDSGSADDDNNDGDERDDIYKRFALAAFGGAHRVRQYRIVLVAAHTLHVVVVVVIIRIEFVVDEHTNATSMLIAFNQPAAHQAQLYPRYRASNINKTS